MLPAVEPGRARPLGVLVTLVIGALALWGSLALWPAPSPARAADGQITIAVQISLAPTWLTRPDRGRHHPLPDAVRAPRRPREADARQRVDAEPGRVVDAVEGRAHLRVRPPQGRAFHNGDPSPRRT